jgi:hypothetical protein
MRQSHTFANRYKPTHRPKFTKECVCRPKKKFIFSFPTFRFFIFFAIAQPKADKYFVSSEQINIVAAN